MAIADMNEFTLLAFGMHKDTLLKELQRFGDAQLCPVAEADLGGMDGLRRLANKGGIDVCESEIQRIKAALGKIRPYYDAPKGLKAMATPPPSLKYDEFDAYAGQYDHQSVCESIGSQSDKLAALAAEKGRLAAERAVLLDWGGMDVPTPTLDSLKAVRWSIGTVAKAQEERFIGGLQERFPASWAECVGHTREDSCVLCLVHSGDFEEAGAYMKDAGYSRASLSFPDAAARLLEANQEATDQATAMEEAAREGLAAYAGEYGRLCIALDYFTSALRRQQAAESFLQSENTIMVRGWAPAQSMDALRRCVNSACGDDYYIEDRPVERDSADVPIKLKNNRLVAAFESITSMYSLPRYNEIDPTPLLTPFYLLFFGLMVGDAGYGLVLFAATSFALGRLRLKAGARQFMQFLFYLSIATMACGLLYGSAFGMAFFTPMRAADGSPKAILDSSSDIVIMIVLSVAIGMAQVLFGVAVKGYALLRRGQVFAAVFDSLFWILAVASGVLLIVGAAGIALPSAAASVGMWVFVASLVGLAATQGRDNPSLVGKVAGGLFGVYGLTSYVGDLVSYTRLVALSLSGAYIAFSFNLMIGLIGNPVSKVLLGGLIFLVGQSMNLGLSVLGGYVHSCRLQYVEFFGKFYEGGGRPFKPLALQNKYVEIID